jgi:uncharacterized protein
MQREMMLSDAAEEREILRAVDPERLELILLPTEKCNFRCTYRYESFEIGRMQPAVVNGIKRLLDVRLPQLRQLELSWFGGEPLLAPQVVVEISSHASLLAAKHSVSYNGNMTTNAYLLTPDLLRRLVSLG